jgi:hypothetical protein
VISEDSTVIRARPEAVFRFFDEVETYNIAKVDVLTKVNFFIYAASIAHGATPISGSSSALPVKVPL